MGVDEVEVLCEVTPLCVSDGIGPGRNAGEIVLRVVAQQQLEVRLGAVLDQCAGDVGDSDMAKAFGDRFVSRFSCPLWNVPGTCVCVCGLTTPSSNGRQHGGPKGEFGNVGPHDTLS